METKTVTSLELATTREIISELQRRGPSFALIVKENEANAGRCINAWKVLPDDRAWMITALINMLKKVDDRPFVEEPSRV